MTINHPTTKVENSIDSKITIIEGNGNDSTGICSVDFNGVDISTEAFSVDVLLKALTQFNMESESNKLFIRRFKSQSEANDDIKTLLLLTDEPNSDTGIVVSPRADGHEATVEERESLSDKFNTPS